MTTINIYIDGLGRTNVRFIRDGRFWVCEGVEYDYLAQGDNKAEALFHFKIGFQRTIQLNIERFGKFDESKWKRGIEVKVPGLIVQRLKNVVP
jgi:hypothetical protein